MNNNKYRIQGVKVGLFDTRGNMVACGRTDRNGEAIFDGIPLGQYFVKQLEGVNGFDQVGNDCVRVNLRKGCECDQVDFLSVQRHGAIKVTKWGYNETSSCRFNNRCGCAPTRNCCGQSNTSGQLSNGTMQELDGNWQEEFFDGNS